MAGVLARAYQRKERLRISIKEKVEKRYIWPPAGRRKEDGRKQIRDVE